LVPVPCFFHVGSNPDHAELCKHIGVVRRAQRYRSIGITGFRSPLEYGSVRDHIPCRDELFTLFHEKLDLFWIKHANALIGGGSLIAGRARLQRRDGLAFG